VTPIHKFITIKIALNPEYEIKAILHVSGIVHSHLKGVSILKDVYCSLFGSNPDEFITKQTILIDF